ncbi:hypothetical protein [Anaerobiospirillum succiniciproducens]|uniref:hypothetical protein n=1 Tax=Anaerobiospirillum succiniciproducens TaxID=13335 RepID=UPI00248D45FF|nr:hypothetical protein [Anaerobiospirillum succiniciproducens]
MREELGVKPGTHYEICRAVHAEANAIINGNPLEIIGGTLYLCGTDVATNAPSKYITPCAMCERLILNAQIAKVVMRDQNRNLVEVNPLDWEDDARLIEEHRRNILGKSSENDTSAHSGNGDDVDSVITAIKKPSSCCGGGCCG